MEAFLQTVLREEWNFDRGGRHSRRRAQRGQRPGAQPGAQGNKRCTRPLREPWKSLERGAEPAPPCLLSQSLEGSVPHTRFPQLSQRGFSSPPLPPLPLQNEKKGEKLLLFTPHLPPKLLNFIPRTNKSIFIAAGGAGSGLTVLPFLFFKVLLNLLGSAGMPPVPSTLFPPASPPPLRPADRAGPHLTSSGALTGPPSPQPARQAGGSALPASCLFGIL